MKFFLFYFLLGLFTSCSFLGYWETVEVDLPSLDSVLFNAFEYSWELSYRDQEGFCVITEIPAERQSVSLILEKGRAAALTLTAVVSAGDNRLFRSRPAGFLYPYDYREFKHAFSWSRGFICELLTKIDETIPADRINMNRLVSRIEEEAEGKSQWSLDFQVLLEELSGGDFSTYDVRSKRSRQVSLNLEEGLWISEDPCGDDLFSFTEVIPLEANLYTGISRYIHETGAILEIHVQPEGTYDYIVY